MTDVAVGFVSVPQAFAGTLQSPAPILHVTPRLFSSLVTAAFSIMEPDAAAMLVIGFVIVTEIGPVTVMVNVAVTVVPLPVAVTVAVTEQPPEGTLATGGGVYVVVAAFVGLSEPSAEDEQAGVVASECTRRTDTLAAAGWAEAERLHEKVGEGPNPVAVAVSEAVPVTSTTVRLPMEAI